MSRQGRVSLVVMAMGVSLVWGCAPGAGSAGGSAAPLGGSAGLLATSQPTTASAGMAGASAGKGPAAAMVNGQPITMDQLNELMLANHGLEALTQLVATAIVQQEAQRQGITITEADVEAENKDNLAQLAPNLPPEDQQRVLQQLLAQRNITPQQWRLVMQRNTMLRKMALADKRVQVTDEMLTQEFNRQYGAKVQVRHIQCASMADAQSVLALLKKGTDFAETAKKLSTNTQSAAVGGLVAPFPRDQQDIPLALRQAAFALKKEGEVSEIVQEESRFHILKLEKLIPPQDVKLEAVKDALRQQLTTALIKQLQAQILQELRAKADVQLVNPVLKAQSALKAQTLESTP